MALLTTPIRADAEEHRGALLRAARDLVGERGPRGFSARDIAVRAGLSQATLYRHFPSKAALIDAVSVDRWQRALAWARTDSRGPAAIVEITSILDRFSAMVTDDRNFIANLGLQIGMAPEPITPLRNRFDVQFGALWTRAQDEGHVRRDVHHQDVMDLVGAIREPERRTHRLGILVGGFSNGIAPEMLLRAARNVAPPWDHGLTR